MPTVLVNFNKKTQKEHGQQNSERAWTTKFYSVMNGSIKQAKQVPVAINYSAHGKRFKKKPDSVDLTRIDRVAGSFLQRTVHSS